jgi:8-amino-7-oxononanoate synthase
VSELLRWLDEQAGRRAEAGLARSLRPRDVTEASELDGGPLDLAGNDYLGLSRHPDVVGAAAAAAHLWGAGATASRLVTGSTTLHEGLERELARFCGQPGALTFSSGYLANLGVVGALADRDTLVVSDAHVHASLVDACRLCRAQVQVVPHNDVGAVRAALAARGRDDSGASVRALVLCESIYSVLGDPAPLPELAAVCAAEGAVLIVDEAHALGVAGTGGGGLVRQHGLAGRPDVVVTATLSKALGGQGGVVLGHRAVREHLVNVARPFIFDTGLSPAAAAAAFAAVEVIDREPGRLDGLRANVEALADGLAVPRPAGAVLTVPMAGPGEAVAMARRCADAGVRVGCFRPPSVPDGVSRLRVTARATLTGPDLTRALAVLTANIGR